MQTHYNKMVLNYKKKENKYRNTTGSLVFDPVTKRAYSYSWWRFVDEVEGKLVFNDYNYSISTSKHQREVRTLLNQLGLKVDLAIPVPKGLQNYSSLEDMILAAEEHLCDKFFSDIIKKQEAYERAKARKLKKKLEVIQ